MIIHVVKEGESIQSISQLYGISETKLILDNELDPLDRLVVGQTIIIAEPEEIYTVKEGDSLVSIADAHGVTVMQLLANNPYLADREFIYPGETIIISYNKKGKIAVHGYVTPNINESILRKTLPYITFLSIMNYTVTSEGEIITYYDDTQIISIAREYGVMPIMLISTLSNQGAANIEIEYELLLSVEFQQRYINNLIGIIKDKGYYGLNVSFQYINLSNIDLYNKLSAQLSSRILSEQIHIFVTINPRISGDTEEVRFERVDYSILTEYSDNTIFMTYYWPINVNPPTPIISIYNLNIFLDYINRFLPPEKIVIGIPIIGYDWELPYIAGFSSIHSLTVESAIDLARASNAVIQFDEQSQTPYFEYTQNNVKHVVWFIDANTINAVLELVDKNNYYGIGVWNLQDYNPQLWLAINCQYDVEKVM